MPLLLVGQWALPPAETAAALQPLLDVSIERWHWRIALIVMHLLMIFVAPLVKQDRLARFWALGLSLALIPICTTFPADRLLFFVGIGSMGLLAQLTQATLGGDAPSKTSRFWRWASTPLVVVLLVIHLVVAPIGLVLRAANPTGPQSLMQKLRLPVPDDRLISLQDLIVINPPSLPHAAYALVSADLEGRQMPRHLRMLAPGFGTTIVERTDADTLRITRPRGYFGELIDSIFRDERHALKVGDTIELTGLRDRDRHGERGWSPRNGRLPLRAPARPRGLSHPGLGQLELAGV
jgi:hypothetical protein